MLLKVKTNIQTHQENLWEYKVPSELDWTNIFSQIMKITIDTKLRRFKYKYLMHILLNDKKLFKYGMVESSLCDFCSTSIKTNIHLFWKCTHIQPFLRQINNFLNEKGNTSSDNLITYQSIRFCNVDSNN